MEDFIIPFEEYLLKYSSTRVLYSVASISRHFRVIVIPVSDSVLVAALMKIRSLPMLMFSDFNYYSKAYSILHLSIVQVITNSWRYLKFLDYSWFEFNYPNCSVILEHLF